MRIWVLLALLAVSASAPNSLWATESAKDCVALRVHSQIGDPGFVVDKLKSVDELPLPQDMVDAIRRHPIHQWVQSKYAGKKLVLVDKTIPTHGHSGETVQARMISKVLHELFSAVEEKESKDLTLRELAVAYGREFMRIFMDSKQRELLDQDPAFLSRPIEEVRPDYPVFLIDIHDSAESYPSKSPVYTDDLAFARIDATGRRLKHLDMTIVKPSNGTSASIDFKTTRKILGIPESTRVVSYYSNTRIELGPLTQTLALDPGIIFLSSSLISAPDVLARGPQDWAKENGYEVKLLSEMREGTLQSTPGKKLLVLNDTRGKMPYLHAAADISVIYGAVNIFESLTVGTPTVVNTTRLDSPVDPQYRMEVFERMLNVAYQTGAARRIQSSSNSAAILKEAIQLDRNFTRPYLIRGEDGKTPVDRMLDHLMEVMKEQDL